MAKPQAISAKDMLRLGKAEYGGKRFAFWMEYYQDEFLAAKAVYENSPSFDVMWKMRYPDPEKFRKELLVAEERRTNPQGGPGRLGALETDQCAKKGTACVPGSMALDE